MSISPSMKIVKQPDGILSRKLKEIKGITPEIRGLVLEMKTTMKEARGVGLAANQVGYDLQIFVIDETLRCNLSDTDSSESKNS